MRCVALPGDVLMGAPVDTLRILMSWVPARRAQTTALGVHCLVRGSAILACAVLALL